MNGPVFDKKERLAVILREMDSLLVAFSGGVDSSFLLSMAHLVLGDRAAAATACSRAYPSREKEAALSFTRELKIDHILFDADITHLPEFKMNHPDRCYYCKKSLAKEWKRIAGERGLRHVVHGANLDDLKDYRPGMRAAGEEGIRAPLLEAGLEKEEIRFLSRDMGISGWDRPASACLASRIPYGQSVTEEKLEMIEAAEAFLELNGFRQCRVRHHGDVARIEVPEPELERIVSVPFRTSLVAELRALGFLHIALDLEGYSTGSLNRALKKETPRGGRP